MIEERVNKNLGFYTCLLFSINIPFFVFAVIFSITTLAVIGLIVDVISTIIVYIAVDEFFVLLFMFGIVSGVASLGGCLLYLLLC